MTPSPSLPRLRPAPQQPPGPPTATLLLLRRLYRLAVLGAALGAVQVLLLLALLGRL